jgi:hypothetical protein
VLTIHSVIKAVQQEAPLLARLFDIVFNKGSLFLCYEFCGRGSLYDALKGSNLQAHISWVVSQVWRLTLVPALCHHRLTRLSA